MRRLSLLVLALLAGCGYHLAGRGDALPKGARTVGIEVFRNRTQEYGLEVRLQRAIEDEFRRRGTLDVVPEAEADLVLRGEIASFTSRPVAFSATDEAVQYQGIIRLGVRLVERGSNRVVNETKSLLATQDFGAVSGVVITTSPHFQRGTLDGRDLINLTNVQLGGVGRRVATQELLDRVARDVYQRAMEGF
jgi:hypothetical protein